MLENDEGATAEVVVEQDQPKSMDDTIRDTLRSLKDQGIEPEAPVEAPEEAAQRIRDESGKFKAKEPADDIPAEVTPEVEAPPVKPAPNTWRKEVADKWQTLPPEVQAEVERREADFHKGIEGYKQKAQFAESIERTLAPYQATLQSLNVAPEKAISELLAADHRLRNGSPESKVAYIAQLAQAYGIDLGQAAQYQPVPIDPTVNALQQRLDAIEQERQQRIYQEQQQEINALNSTLAAFAADPKHSHYEAVREHMASLLQGGSATTLEDAYEQAVYANPTTRALLIAEQQAKARAEAAEKAKAAKAAASVNVRSRPSMPVSAPIGSMDETIRANYRRLMAGG